MVGLEIIVKLADVLEVEPAELLRLPSRRDDAWLPDRYGSTSRIRWQSVARMEGAPRRNPGTPISMW
jgi:hypothetical protein